jgi:hypothetical protein
MRAKRAASPAWAAASRRARAQKKGDLFGDMYVIWGETQGIPILSDASLVQPVDVDGAPIEIDAEGAPVDPTLAQKVKHARLNVGRAPPPQL